VRNGDCRAFLRQAGARSVSEYAQQVGRGGRDGLPTKCVCFFCPRDSNGIRDSINKAKITTSAARNILNAIRERSTSATTAFLHRSDFTASGIDDHQIDGVLAALTGMRVLLLGPMSPAKFAVLPGPVCEVLSDTPISVFAQALWNNHISPDFTRQAALHATLDPPARSRLYARDACGYPPFLSIGVGGPAEVFDAVADLRRVGLVHPRVEETGRLYILSVMQPVDTVAMPLPLWREVDDVGHAEKADLDEAERFFSRSSCLNRRLCNRFGAPSERGRDVCSCACSLCLPGDLQLRSFCP